MDKHCGLEALALENRMLMDPGPNVVIFLGNTSAGFLIPGVPRLLEKSAIPTSLDHDTCLGHEDLRGKAVEQLIECLGEDKKKGDKGVDNMRSLSAQEPVFLAPQIGF